MRSSQRGEEEEQHKEEQEATQVEVLFFFSVRLQPAPMRMLFKKGMCMRGLNYSPAEKTKAGGSNFPPSESQKGIKSISLLWNERKNGRAGETPFNQK